MKYLQAKATATPTTDRGEFQAIVATYDRDREGDRIQPGAFAASIMEWRSVGRRLPLHWNHIADQIIGDVDPQEMWEDDDQGLEVNGRIDLDTEQGQAVWKSLKQNRLGFSFGYAVKRERKRRDGGRDLLELDVFEISVTPSPMNNRTRVVSTKSADAPVSFDEKRYNELRAAYMDEKAKAVRLAEEEEAAHRRTYDFPKPPTRLIVTETGVVKEVDARHPDDISPGVSIDGRLLPTPNEVKRAREREEREKREFAERRAAVEEELKLRKAAAEAREAQRRRELPPGFSGEFR